MSKLWDETDQDGEYPIDEEEYNETEGGNDSNWAERQAQSFVQDDSNEVTSDPSPLDKIALVVNSLASHGHSMQDIRHTVFDSGAKQDINKYNENMFFSYAPEDEVYMKMIGEMYPTINVRAVAGVGGLGDRDKLYRIVATHLSNYLWNCINAKYEKLSDATKTVLADNVAATGFELTHTAACEGVDAAVDLSVPFDGLNYTNLYYSAYMLYEVFEESIKAVKSDKSEPVEVVEETPAEVKTKYIKQLMKRKFITVDNNVSINGRDGVHSKLLGVIRGLYVPTPIKELGYSDKLYMVNESLLESYNVSAKNADIWNPTVYTLDEDLMFRVFVREDKISYTVLVKLPSGMDLSVAGKEKLLSSVPMLFSNMGAGSASFTSSYIKPPRVCNLGNTRKVDCQYDCVEFVMAKDLLSFKNSSWLLSDYMDACEGTDNEFTAFEGLSLGEKIVVGVMPGALKDETFDCSGRYQNSVILGGKAGSGKTTMYDSLLVQAVALRGSESRSDKDKTDMGNGAAILIDAKQEWVTAWASVYRDLGLPFYGFSGEILPQSDMKWMVEKRGTPTVETVPFAVPEYFAGMMFTKVVYEIIQYCFNKMKDVRGISVKDMSEYNYAGGIPEVPRIPRTMILVDEINELHAAMKRMGTINNIDMHKTVYKSIIAARLTRTSGYLWTLGGQDPGKQQIESAERENYGYNIFGSMGTSRYEYFNVVESPAVKEYEAKNGTDADPNPIMQQGMFYAGPAGKTSLVKCMYLPTNERKQALSRVSHEGLLELDALVRYGLENGLFDTLQTMLPKNNIIYSALRNLGIITNIEFEFYTNRLFNVEADKGSSEEALTDDVMNPFSDQDIADFDDAPKQEKRPSTLSGASKGFDKFGDVPLPGAEPLADLYTHGSSAPDITSTLGRNQPTVKSVPSVESDPHEEMKSGYDSVYSENLQMEFNPFAVYGSNNPMSCVAALKMTSQIVMKEITRVFGSPDRVESIEITKQGLVINNVAFRPKVSSDIIMGMPYDIQHSVKNGDLTELFDFKDLHKFRYLSVLRVDSPRLAEGRLRRELGIAPNKPWSVLFRKLRSLRELYIAGYRIDGEDSAKAYDNSGRGGFTFAENVRNSLGVPLKAVTSSRMSKMWDSKPVKIFTGAAGWTIGVKAMTVTAGFLGVWGLLFGAVAGYGIYKNVRGKK